MTSNITTPFLSQSAIETAEHFFDNWFNPLESGFRNRAREFLRASRLAERMLNVAVSGLGDMPLYVHRRAGLPVSRRQPEIGFHCLRIVEPIRIVDRCLAIPPCRSDRRPECASSVDTGLRGAPTQGTRLSILMAPPC